LRREDVLELFRFIDWILALPPELERGFDETIREELEANKMPYMTRWERQGLEQGLRYAVDETLKVRFQTLPDDIQAKIERIEDAEALRTLHHAALVSDSLESFRAALARYTAA
jgi:hypothetical protein